MQDIETLQAPATPRLSSATLKENERSLRTITKTLETVSISEELHAPAMTRADAIRSVNRDVMKAIDDFDQHVREREDFEIGKTPIMS